MQRPPLLRRSWLWILLALGLVGVSVFIVPPLLAAGQAAWQAQRWLSTGKPAQAAPLLARAAERFPWDGGWWESAGRAAWLGGDAASAVRWLETGRDQEGLSGVGWVVLGEAYQQVGDPAAALGAWRIAEELGASPGALAADRLEAHRCLGDWSGMTRDLQALAALRPGDSLVSYQLGLLLAVREPQKAQFYLAQAAELDPNLQPSASSLLEIIRRAQLQDEPAFTLLSVGRALAALAEWELAGEAFRQALAARPDYAEAWAYLGEARQHPSAAAISAFGLDGLEGEKQDPIVHPARRCLSAAAGAEAPSSGQATALAALQRAVEIDPKSLSAHLFLALYWQRQNRFDLALEVLREAARLAPSNPSVHVELGNTLAAAGNLTAARAAFERAAALAPHEAVYWRALTLFTLRSDVQVRSLGLPAARQAVLLDPQSPTSLDVFAQVLLRLNDPLNAQRFLERALQIQANYAPAYLHLGWAYLLAGESRKAYDAFRQAQALAPGSSAAQQAQWALETYFP